MPALALSLAASVTGAALLLPAGPAAAGAADQATVGASAGRGVVCTAAAPAGRDPVLSPAWTEHVAARTVLVREAWTERVVRTDVVREAWSEQQLVTPARTEEVVVTPTWDEVVVDVAAWTETVEHPAVTRTVEHPAVTRTEWLLRQQNGNGEKWTDRESFPGQGWEVVDQREVVVTPAWTETVTDHPAWTESIEHPAVTHVVTHPAVTRTEEVAAAEYRTLDHPAETVERIELVEHPAEWSTIPGYTVEHPAVLGEAPPASVPAACGAAADPADVAGAGGGAGVVLASAEVPSGAVTRGAASPGAAVDDGALADGGPDAALAATGSDAAALAAGAVGAVGLGLVVLGAAYLARRTSRDAGDRR